MVFLSRGKTRIIHVSLDLHITTEAGDTQYTRAWLNIWNSGGVSQHFIYMSTIELLGSLDTICLFTYLFHLYE